MATLPKLVKWPMSSKIWTVLVLDNFGNLTWASNLIKLDAFLGSVIFMKVEALCLRFPML